jgi:hypothetical protein
MHKEDKDSALHSRDLDIAEIESIEDLLRTRGFFDTAEPESERVKKDEGVLVS